MISKHIYQSWHFWYPIIWFCITIPTNARTFTTEIYPMATTDPIKATTEFPLTRYERGLEDYDEEQMRLESEGRGMSDDDDMSSSKAVKNDPWQGYIDFLINEGSFKFWAVFEVVTSAILIYSALAAIYYAKYNFVQADYDYYDFFGRSESRSTRSVNNLWSGLSAETFQRIIDAISSQKYS